MGNINSHLCACLYPLNTSKTDSFSSLYTISKWRIFSHEYFGLGLRPQTGDHLQQWNMKGNKCALCVLMPQMVNEHSSKPFLSSRFLLNMLRKNDGSHNLSLVEGWNWLFVANRAKIQVLVDNYATELTYHQFCSQFLTQFVTQLMTKCLA